MGFGYIKAKRELHFQRHLEYLLVAESKRRAKPKFRWPSAVLKSLIALKQTWVLRNLTGNFINQIRVRKTEPAACSSMTTTWFASEAKTLGSFNRASWTNSTNNILESKCFLNSWVSKWTQPSNSGQAGYIWDVSGAYSFGCCHIRKQAGTANQHALTWDLNVG